jgi:hypothetical protein
MKGGEISGNTASRDGGGVHVSSGTFLIVTGTIYGSEEAVETTLRNTASWGAALYNNYYYGGTAQHGTFIDGEWESRGNLDTTNNTIKVKDGVLQQ